MVAPIWARIWHDHASGPGSPSAANEASVRPFSGRSFAQQRREAVSAEWLSAKPATPRAEDLLISCQDGLSGFERYGRQQLRRGVAIMSVADFAEPERSTYSAELDEQARRKGVLPIRSADELRADVFESDEELDEFLADLEAFRHEHLA